MEQSPSARERDRVTESAGLNITEDPVKDDPRLDNKHLRRHCWLISRLIYLQSYREIASGMYGVNNDSSLQLLRMFAEVGS